MPAGRSGAPIPSTSSRCAQNPTLALSSAQAGAHAQNTGRRQKPEAAHGPAKPTTIDEEEGRRGQGSAMVTTKPRAVAWAKAVLRWLAEGGAQVRHRVWFWRCFAEQLCKNDPFDAAINDKHIDLLSSLYD